MKLQTVNDTFNCVYNNFYDGRMISNIIYCQQSDYNPYRTQLIDVVYNFHMNYLPELPNPPSPLSVELNSATSSNSI